MRGPWGRLVGRAVLSLLWLLQALPLAVQAALGRGLGALLYRLAGSRRRVALRNVALCLPELDEPARQGLVRQIGRASCRERVYSSV